MNYELTGGWWANGKFWRGFSEVRADGLHYSTGLVADCTPASNDATKFQGDFIKLARTAGIEAARATHPRFLHPLSAAI